VVYLTWHTKKGYLLDESKRESNAATNSTADLEKIKCIENAEWWKLGGWSIIDEMWAWIMEPSVNAIQTLKMSKRRIKRSAKHILEAVVTLYSERKGRI